MSIVTWMENNPEERNMKARFFMLPMLLLATACQRELDTPEPVVKPEAGSASNTFTLTIQANKGTETRALDLDGNTLNAYWKDTEKVKVYKGSDLLGTLNVHPDGGEKPATATLSGDITADGLSVDNQLTLLIPRETWDYTQQSGVLTGEGSIEDTYDYAIATVRVSAIDGTAVTTTEAEFENQQSLYRFSFKNGTASLSLKEFTVYAAGGSLVQSRSFSGGEWASVTGALVVKPSEATAEPLYVSLRNENSTTADTYSFVVTASDDALFLATKAIPASVLATPGKFIGGTITVSQPDFSPVQGTVDANNVL